MQQRERAPLWCIGLGGSITRYRCTNMVHAGLFKYRHPKLQTPLAPPRAPEQP